MSFYPLIYPLQVFSPLFQAVYKRFHARRAILFHLLRDVSVYIQSERCRMVTQVFLNGFNTLLGFDYDMKFEIEFLNWYASKLWFVLEGKDIIIFDPETNTME